MNTFSVTMLLTEQCNLRCTYCYERFLLTAPKPDQLIRIQQFFKLLSSNYQSIHISFFGGEPLLAHRQMNQIMQYCTTLGSTFSFSLTTNGLLLSQKKLDGYITNGLDQFQVTLDGTEESHNRMRMQKLGGGTFSTIYSNLLSYRTLNAKFKAVIRVNASPDNSEDIESLAVMLNDDFGSDSRYKTFIRPVGKWGGCNDALLTTHTKESFARIEQTFYSKLPESMRYVMSKRNICYAAAPNHLLIYPDGTLGKCTIAIHDLTNRIGYIRDNGQIEIESQSLLFWSRGFRSGSPAELACPYHATS